MNTLFSLFFMQLPRGSASRFCLLALRGLIVCGLACPTVAMATVATGSMANARSQHTASLLADGRVMVVGGRNSSSSVAENEIYNPATGTWMPVQRLNAARVGHAAVVLPSGDQVLIIGGTVGNEGSAGRMQTASVERCSAFTASACVPMASMRVALSGLHATLLGNGKVLVAGQSSIASNDIGLFDPAANTWSTMPSPPSAAVYPSAMLTLADGSAMLISRNNNGDSFSTIFNHITNTWGSAAVSVGTRGLPLRMPFADNSVLWVGFFSDPSRIAVPPFSTWRPLSAPGNFNTEAGATVAVSSASRVAVMGGATFGTPDNKINIYNPLADAWTTEASMLTRRVSHTSTRLANGDILIVGGDTINVPGQNSAELLKVPVAAPVAQAITFTAPFVGGTAAFVAQTSFALTATASSNLPVAFSTSTPTICSVNAAAVTMLALGSCTVVATQLGNAAFLAAPSVSQTILFAPPPPASFPPATPQTISTLAGTADVTGGGVVNGVPLTGRTFNTANVITDRDGNIFFTNADGLIYCISARSGLLFTIGGIGSATLGTNGFGGDGGPATLATFNNPMGLVFDTAGNLYIADTGNNRVRRINLSAGIVTTIAGGGASLADNIQGVAAQLTAPRSLAFGPDGLLYIADGSNRIRRLNVVTGVLSYFAGTGVAGYGGDNGAALSAVFNDIYYITFDFQGNLFIVDRGNNRIRCINRAGIVLPVAGTGALGFGGDGGLGVNALFRDIRSIAFDFWGQLYISDAGNNRIRRLNLLTGFISTFSVNNTSFNPYGLYFDALGSLYTAELGLLRAVRFIEAPSFALNFPTRARVVAGSLVLSDERFLTGFTGAVTLSIDGGEYNIGCSAANPFVSTLTTITITNPAQKVCLRVTAGSGAGDSRTANFRANNTSSPFTVLTLDPDLLPRYRIYVPILKRHLYTTDTNEYNVLVGFSNTYSGEGISHYLYRAPVGRAAQTAIPYYRMYFNPQQRHFYTSDFNEYNTIRKDTVFASDEGITGYIFPRYGVPGAVPLYRLYNVGINSHLWTIDSNEFNVLSQNGWTPEGQPGNARGVDGYVFP